MAMEDTTNHAPARTESEDLHTYLHDHIAGAQHAVQLFEALKEAHAGTPIGEFADALLGEVSEDLAALKGIAGNAGADRYQFKELAGWLADKLSRLKLAPLTRSFHTFEALEFLSLGILGKRALWRTLSSVASEHPELQGVNYAALIERADSQYAATEEMRLRVATQAFNPQDRA
jgi:hypothetical protein